MTLTETYRRNCPNFPPVPVLWDQAPASDPITGVMPLVQSLQRVAIIGSGNWGSTVCRIAASNVLRHADIFHPTVRMWVFEEIVDGRKLTEVINETKENPKYLPGVQLGGNVEAVADLQEAATGADLLVFVSPHQFLKKTCQTLKPIVGAEARAISLIKGMDITAEGPQLLSALVRRDLGIDCSVLMGANIANDVAREEFSEATIGYRDAEAGRLFHRLFDTEYFQCTPIEDVEGTELCGTLKNIVALAAGFCDGLCLGSNSKAAVMRIGMNEMRKFARKLFPTAKDETFFESCGVADVITTCMAGRNRKVAEAFVASEGGKSWAELEAELLHGQKLQGVLTCLEAQTIIRARGWEQEFPLFTTIYRIVQKEIPPRDLVRYKELVR